MQKLIKIFNKIKKNFAVLKAKKMAMTSFFILYMNDKGDLIESISAETRFSTLDAPPALSFIVPRIGETVIDTVTHIEYEVKDIVRTIKNDEYGIHVRLVEREKSKYNF